MDNELHMVVINESGVGEIVESFLPPVEAISRSWPDGWFECSPFPDGVRHTCLGQFGGIRGHIRRNPDGSYTAYHGDLQLGTVKDLDKAKTAVESGKRIRQRGDGRKAKAAKAAKGVGNVQPQGTAESAQSVPVAADGADTAAAASALGGDQQAIPGLPLPLPVVLLPPVVGVGEAAAMAFVESKLAEAMDQVLPVYYPVPTTVDRGMQEFLDASRAQPLPALPTEAAAPKPKADDIMTLDTLRGFMPPDWCDRLEAVAVEGFQLKEQELAYKVNYRGSNHRDVPKYYDGPPTIGVEPTVTDLLKQVGLDKVRVPGGLIMLVPGTSEARLNREKLLRAGVTVEVLEACTDPGTPYTSVTFKRDRR